MTTMITEVYEAFKSCGVPEDKATKAAQALSTHQRDLKEIKSDLLQIKMELSFVRVVTLSIILSIPPMCIAIIWKVFQ